MKQKYDAQKSELQSLQQLYESIGSCPELEAHDLVQEIRWSDQPLEALRRIQNRALTVNRSLPKPRQGPAMSALDAHALRNADIKGQLGLGPLYNCRE